MLHWTSKQFDGNRSLFKYPYSEELKQQLRSVNCYRIAEGSEEKPVMPERENNGDTTLIIKMTDKIDEWEKRNQLGFALITMSVNKTVLNKINSAATNCREAYKVLQDLYGGALTVAEMAYIENLLDKKKEKDETAESYIENWKSLSLQAGITRNNENDTRQLAKLIKLFERDNLFKSAIEMSYLTDKNFDQTVTLIIKEDEKNRMTNNDNTPKVNFETDNNTTTILKIKQTDSYHDKSPYRENRERSPYRENRERSPYRGDQERSSYREYRDRSRDRYRENRDRSPYGRTRDRSPYWNRRERSPYTYNRHNISEGRDNRKREFSRDKYGDRKSRSKSNDKDREKSTEYNTEKNKKQKTEYGKCWNFEETGTCKFGKNCKFSHSK